MTQARLGDHLLIYSKRGRRRLVAIRLSYTGMIPFGPIRSIPYQCTLEYPHSYISSLPKLEATTIIPHPIGHNTSQYILSSYLEHIYVMLHVHVTY